MSWHTLIGPIIFQGTSVSFFPVYQLGDLPAWIGPILPALIVLGPGVVVADSRDYLSGFPCHPRPGGGLASGRCKIV